MIALQLGSVVVAKVCLEKQQQNLREFSEGFAELADPDFRATQPTLMQSFVDMVSGMTVKVLVQTLCHHYKEVVRSLRPARLCPPSLDNCGPSATFEGDRDEGVGTG